MLKLNDKMVDGTRFKDTPSVVTFCLVFSLASCAFSNAQPYKINVNDIKWATFAAPSPLELSAETSNDNVNYERSDEEIIVRKKDVSILS